MRCAAERRNEDKVIQSGAMNLSHEMPAKFFWLRSFAINILILILLSFAQDDSHWLISKPLPKPISLSLNHFIKKLVKIFDPLLPVQVSVNILKGIFRQGFGFTGQQIF